MSSSLHADRVTSKGTRVLSDDMSPLEFVEFTPDHFAEYQSWFDDPILYEHLGPTANSEWLESVMTDSTHQQYSVFQIDESKNDREKTLVSVVGIQCPVVNHLEYVITDIAIKPCYRQQGVGKRVIATLLELHPLRPGESWAAFVDISNPDAMAFFDKLGWSRKSNAADQNGMIEFGF